MKPASVAVVGSANLDVVMTVGRLPAPGETVLGDDLFEVAGGKGLNQAVAAARYAVSTFIGCLGDDPASQALMEALQRGGVNTRHVQRSTRPTGRAFISVAPDGENSIVVLPLANGVLDVAHVENALDVLSPTCVLSQMEIPFESVEQASTWAATNHARFVLNASPVRAFPLPLLSRCDPLIVNASEAGAILELAGITAPVDSKQAAQMLSSLAATVVVTDGSTGAWVGGAEGVALVRGHPVDARDTTGAGDEFAGVLTAHLANGVSLETSARLANRAAARVVQVPRPER